MSLIFRLFYFLLKHWKKADLNPLDTSTLVMRVLPNDLDINMHMNNGRYLTIMDIGRLDLLNRTGGLDILLKQKMMPIVGASTIEFSRPLKMFQKFELQSRIIHWDEKWFYLQQTFISKNKIVASAYIKGLLRNKNGNIRPQNFIDQLGNNIVSPNEKCLLIEPNSQ